MKELECKRCKHKWWPRTPRSPHLCPSCKSKYWKEERQNAPKKVSKSEDYSSQD